MGKGNKPNITLFHCINSYRQAPDKIFEGCEVKVIQMPCSSMTKDVYLLRAFEAGADAVLVFVCPEDKCRYAEGSIRAKKRVQWVRNLLDEIGMDGKRQLAIYNLLAGDDKSVETIIKDTVKGLKEII
ncbi:hydrogenase iron-sulfur subunit [Actinomycetota bacterium]